MNVRFLFNVIILTCITSQAYGMLFTNRERITLFFANLHHQQSKKALAVQTRIVQQSDPAVLDLQALDLSELPQHTLTAHQKNMVLKLLISHNQLASLTAHMLTGFGSLTHLDLSRNSISHLDANAFKPAPNLISVDLSSNNLGQDLECCNLFGFLTSQKNQANATRPRIYGGIEPGTFANLPQLAHLNLMNNCFDPNEHEEIAIQIITDTKKILGTKPGQLDLWLEDHLSDKMIAGLDRHEKLD